MSDRVFALAAAVWLACAGCAAQQSRTVSGQLTFGPTGAVGVQLSIGDVTVTGAKGSLVTWSAREVARRAADLQRMDIVTDKLPGQLSIRGIQPDDCHMCAIHLVLSVPKTVNVEVHTNVGNVVVDGMGAAVVAGSQVGNVEVTGAGAKLRAQSRVGNVRVTLPSMAGITAVQELSSVGSVALAIPGSADATIHLATSIGRITGDVAVPRTSGLGSDTRVRLGSGRVPIELRTQTGDVDLRKL